jgi:class 3 adenylate cyclase
MSFWVCVFLGGPELVHHPHHHAGSEGPNGKTHPVDEPPPGAYCLAAEPVGVRQLRRPLRPERLGTILPKGTMATRDLPSGAITFLFSDIEGSTRLLQELGDGYIALLQHHNRIFREVIREGEGAEVSTEGDSFFVVFPSPLGAVDAATRIQRSLAAHPFPAPVRVRIGLHTGQGQLAAGDYVGIDVHRAARIAAGHGGQILISDATRIPRMDVGQLVRDRRGN